jgi:hypothetical protein
MGFEEWQKMSAGSSPELHATRTDPRFTGNPDSPAYGHAVETHGAQRPGYKLIDRARTTNTPQGQWIDNHLIVEAEMRAPLTPGEHVVNMGKPVGKVYLPNGQVLDNVQIVKVIRRTDGTLKTAYPFA